jgi:tetratricopeptide (TPR) repeat protein
MKPSGAFAKTAVIGRRLIWSLLMRRPAIVMLLLLAFALAAAPATPMGQAEALLATGQFEKARDLLQTIVAQDPKDARAWEAMLVAQLALRKDDEALATARKVLALGPAGRVTVMNAAIAHARVDDPIAGAKLIHQHLEANPEPLDEPMLDVLGTILSQVDPDDRTDAACVLATRFYDAYNAKLEAQVSGRKRWGVRWLNADEADENRQRLAAAEAATAAVQKKIKKLEDDIADARRDVFRATELAKRRPREKDKVEKAVVRLNELEAAHLSLQTDLQRAISDEVRPEFLESLDPVMLDDNTPPPVGTPVEQRFKRPVEPKRLGGFDGDVSVLPMPVRENEPPSQRNQTSRPVRREGPPQ